MNKGNNARDGVTRELQRELILKYRARSFSFREIADRVSEETGRKITHQTAFNDYIEALEAAKNQVEQTAVHSLVSQLEKLDRLENQYWQAWEKSVQNPRKKVRKKREKDVADFLEKEEQEEEQNGDVAYLNGVKSCIELRCKMMGYITSNIDIKSGGKELAAITGMIVK